MGIREKKKGHVDKHTNENEQNPNQTQGRWDHRRSGQFSIAEVGEASIRPCRCHDKSRQQADQPVQSRLSLGKRGGWGGAGNLLRGNQKKLKRREKRNLAGALDGEPCTKKGESTGVGQNIHPKSSPLGFKFSEAD